MGKMADSTPAIDFKTNDERRDIMLSYTDVLCSERLISRLNKSGNDDENSILIQLVNV